MPNWRSIAGDLLPPALIRAVKAAIPQSAPRVSPYQRDEFLTWLTFINPGMLASSNLALMDHAIRTMPDAGAVIEIGSFAGLSLNHILHIMKQIRRSNLVFSVDEWHFEGSEKRLIPGSSVQFSDYREHVIDTFRRNLLLFHSGQLSHHIVASSDKFFELWEQKAETTDFFERVTTLGGPISLAYIDGTHTYEQSWRDFVNVDRFLLPGGFIIFDDSADGSDFGSHRTAREAASRPDYELVDKTPNYCIAKRR
ncbi:MAG: class I SAM-dependent methyltransferase [Stellaceae bacterium]